MNRVTESRLRGQFRCVAASCTKPPVPLRYVMRIPGGWLPVTHSALQEVVDRCKYLALPAPGVVA
ncbi:Uncharacterised protein [Serratia proteamaculans]|nr:Uncharacterised protein [Serratia proteamaculans]CAI1172978.1 Uncharacterised protein [Serratia proteamaculans]